MTHGDICPENLIRTPDGALRPIDEKRLALRPLAYDLARAVHAAGAGISRRLSVWRWTPGRILRYRAFWIAGALATSAEYRFNQPARLRPILAALRALAANVRRPD